MKNVAFESPVALENLAGKFGQGKFVVETSQAEKATWNDFIEFLERKEKAEKDAAESHYYYE